MLFSTATLDFIESVIVLMLLAATESTTVCPTPAVTIPLSTFAVSAAIIT